MPKTKRRVIACMAYLGASRLLGIDEALTALGVRHELRKRVYNQFYPPVPDEIVVPPEWLWMVKLARKIPAGATEDADVAARRGQKIARILKHAASSRENRAALRTVIARIEERQYPGALFDLIVYVESAEGNE